MTEPGGANLPRCCKHETCISGIHPDGLRVHTQRPEAKVFWGVFNCYRLLWRNRFLLWPVSGCCSQCCRSYWTTALSVQHKSPLNSSESPWLLFFFWILLIKASFQLYFPCSFPLLCNHVFAVATKCQSHTKMWLITPPAYVPKPHNMLSNPFWQHVVFLAKRVLNTKWKLCV